MKRTLQFALVLAAFAATPLFAAKNDALSLVPANAVSVGVVKLSEMRTSPLSSFLFQHTDNISTNGEGDKFLAETGLDPKKDIDTLVVAASPQTTFGKDADVLVAAEGRFNAARLTAAVVSHGAIKKTASNRAYYLVDKKEDSGKAGAVAFISDKLVVAGNESSVVNALAAYAAGGTTFLGASALGQDSTRIAPNATAWAIVDVTRAKRLTESGPKTSANEKQAAFNAAIKNVSTVGMWATDAGDQLKINAFGLANDSETLQLIEDTLRGGLAALRLAVQEKQPDMVSVLRRFDVARTDNAVTISGSIPADALRKLAAKKTASK